MGFSDTEPTTVTKLGIRVAGGKPFSKVKDV